LAANDILATAGLGRADITVVIPAHARGGSYAILGQGSAGCAYGLPHCEAKTSHRTTAVARTQAIAWVVAAEIKLRWPPSEDEIVRAAITVILVALVSIIAVAAAALLTMG
jgi:hypothetical protein